MKTKELPMAVNHGENIRRFRSLMGIKQDMFAATMSKLIGEKFNQGQVSALESKETIPSDLLQHAATAIGVPVKLLETMPAEIDKGLLNLFLEAVTNNNGAAIGCHHVDIVNHPIEKYDEMFAKNEQLYKDLLAEKDKTIAVLERLLSAK